MFKLPWLFLFDKDVQSKPLSVVGTRRILARLTSHILHPDLLDDLDAKALVIGVAAGEVAIGEQLARNVAAGETEFFPVAHPGSGGVSTLNCVVVSGV